MKRRNNPLHLLGSLPSVALRQTGVLLHSSQTFSPQKSVTSSWDGHWSCSRNILQTVTPFDQRISFQCEVVREFVTVISRVGPPKLKFELALAVFPADKSTASRNIDISRQPKIVASLTGLFLSLWLDFLLVPITTIWLIRTKLYQRLGFLFYCGFYLYYTVIQSVLEGILIGRHVIKIICESYGILLITPVYTTSGDETWYFFISRP